MKKQTLVLLLASLALSGCALDDVKECKDGETRCVGDSINTCIDGNWWGYTQCREQKCEMKGDEAVCANICENGDTKCIGNTLFECTNNVWPDTMLGMECGDEKSCMSVKEFSFCANPNNSQEIVEVLIEHNIQCDEDLLLCGENNSLYNCISNELQLKQACGSQICDRDETGLMACIDECTPEATKCEGNNLVTCTKDKVYGTPKPCESGTVCTLDSDGISACVERKQSFAICDSPKCIGNTLFQCIDGIYDNGTSCGNDICGLNESHRYACLPSKVCETGEMQCSSDNTPQQCNENGKWENTEVSCGEEAFCVTRHREAFCVCLDGYFNYESQICEIQSCEAQCNGNYAISCDFDTTIQTYCPFGCNKETYQCNACVDKCTEDGQYLLKCQQDNIVLKEYCKYGCADSACIRPDSDNDGVPDDEDACPYNGAESTDTSKCDNLLDEATGTFYVYAPQNIPKLRELLEADMVHACSSSLDEPCEYNPVVQTIEIKNDLNLALYGGLIEDENGCTVSEALVGLDLYRVALRGNDHKITATQADKRCTLPYSPFKAIRSASIYSLTLDIDVNNGRGLIADEFFCNRPDENGSINNVTVSGKLTNNNGDAKIGGLVGYAHGDYPFSPYANPTSAWKCALEFDYVKANHITVSAPNSEWVGGLIGYIHQTRFYASAEPYIIDLVLGNTKVGGAFGYVYIFTGFDSVMTQHSDYLRLKVGTVEGFGDYIGGFSGYGQYTMHMIVDVENVIGQNTSNYVGGFSGYFQTFNSNPMNTIAVRAKSITGNSKLGGLFGAVDSSSGGALVLTNAVVKIDTIKEFQGSNKYSGGLIGQVDASYSTHQFTNVSVDANTINDSTQAGGLFGYFNGSLSLKNVSVRANLFANGEKPNAGGITGNSLRSGNTLTTQLDTVAITSSRFVNGSYTPQSTIAPGDLPYYGDSTSENYKGPQAVYWFNQNAENTHPWGNTNADDTISGFASTNIEATVASLNENLARLNAEEDTPICSNCTWAADSSFGTKSLTGEDLTANFPVLHIPKLEEELNKLEELSNK